MTSKKPKFLSEEYMEMLVKQTNLFQGLLATSALLEIGTEEFNHMLEQMKYRYPIILKQMKEKYHG